MDKLVIRRLQLYAAIGVSAAEREVGQRLVVNVEVGYDLSRAGQSDHISDTISYAALARAIHDIGTRVECRLLESMAEQMCREILDRFPVADVRLQLLKVPPPVEMTIESAGVELYRRRDPAAPPP